MYRLLIISADANERMINPETDVLNEDFLVKPVDLNLLLNKIGDKLGLSWLHQHEQNPEQEQAADQEAQIPHGWWLKAKMKCTHPFHC